MCSIQKLYSIITNIVNIETDLLIRQHFPKGGMKIIAKEIFVIIQV